MAAYFGFSFSKVPNVSITARLFFKGHFGEPPFMQGVGLKFQIGVGLQVRIDVINRPLRYSPNCRRHMASPQTARLEPGCVAAIL